jgi:hypothetical protein
VTTAAAGTTPAAASTRLGTVLLGHMDEQLTSVRTLLELTLKQGGAIRSRDVDGVVRRLADINVEVGRRERIEAQRSALLEHAAAALGKPADEVTLRDMAPLMAAPEAAAAEARSSELRGLLAEVHRETQLNRALMRQELSFLDHLLRLAGHPSEPGYRPSGEQPLSTAAGAPNILARRLFDSEA